MREVATHSGEEVWNYVSKAEQVLGCSRLANGNTLLAEQGPAQAAVEVNPKGEVVHITPLHTNQEHFHLQTRNIHQLANGNILAAHEGEGAVREGWTPSGKVVWEYTGVENAGDALRLPNGNTLICCGTQKRVIEVTPDKQIVWEFGAADAPELNITWVSSIQQLKNGHLLIGNFCLRGQEGKGAHAFEVTRDKKGRLAMERPCAHPIPDHGAGLGRVGRPSYLHFAENRVAGCIHARRGCDLVIEPGAVTAIR